MKRDILNSNLKHGRRFKEMLREIEEVEDTEIGVEANLVGLEKEFMIFCDREGIGIVPT